jgi:chromosome segregation ATPase
MSRAGILYGITMGIDGISKVLSVKFDEAALIPK